MTTLVQGKQSIRESTCMNKYVCIILCNHLVVVIVYIGHTVLPIVMKLIVLIIDCIKYAILCHCL